MPQINTSLPEEMIMELQNISKESQKSFSNTVKLMIEYGLDVYKQLQGKDNKNSEKPPEDKNTEYLLKIFGVTTDILRCVYDKKKSKHGAENADEAINKIELRVQKFLNKE
jgi:hypothetical protein